ncbi:MAG: VWA domain-containing protein, partial [Wujia sp.]
MRKCMNKVVACFMVMAMAAGLTGCGGNKTSKEEENVTSVVQENNRTEAASEEAGADVEYADDACEEIWDFQNNKSDASVEMDIARGETEFNTNEYNNVAENGWMQVENAPLSTFAADVDTASYSQIRSCIQNGYDVDPSMVRIEEMINYFHYDYEKPKKGEKFAVYTEYMDCPWNTDTKLAMVAMNTEDIDFSEAPASNLVFLIDTSGSMFDDNKLPLVQQSMCLLAENLTKKDRVSVVTYAGSDEVRLQGAKGNEYHKIAQTIEELEAWGSTNGSVGIETAYEIARENFIEGGNNRVILCTDGDLNVGVTSEGELERLITKEKESGVFLSVLGVGYGNYKDNKLE